MTSQQLIAAIKAAENIEIDYDSMGLNEDEVEKLDHAVDLVFEAARAYSKIIVNYRELKILDSKDF